MTKSYTGQEKRLTVPANQLNGIVEIPLGFQPLGIANRGNLIAIADYFGPAICLAKVRRNKRGLRFGVDWIRGVSYGAQSVRLFPDIWQPGGANRAQTVNFGPGGQLWVTRNGGRTIFVLSPLKKSEERWVLSAVKTLPGQGMVHSALLSGDKLITIESSFDLETWFQRQYGSEKLEIVRERPSEPWLYGVELLEEGIITITDFCCKKPHGIYINGKLVVSEVWGTGICLIAEGALMTKHGQSAPGPFNGEPGGLIFVPRKMFR